MLYLLAKALISGAIVAVASDVAKRSPAFGALIVSLPLVSILAMIWLWNDTRDGQQVANLAFGTFWFVLPSLPMFLVLPATLRYGVPFWPALLGSCALTVVLYVAMVWALARFGITF